MMSRQAAKIALSRHTQILRESTSTENWNTLDNIVEKWREVEKDMAEARANKEAPLRWIPKSFKVKDVNRTVFHTPSAVAEAKVKSKETVLNQEEAEHQEKKNEEVLCKAKSEHSVQAKVTQDPFESQKDLVKLRLEKAAEKKRHMNVDRHTMVDPQKLFTPTKKPFFDIPRSSSFNASNSEEPRQEGKLSIPLRTEGGFRKWSGIKKNIRKRDWNANSVSEAKSEESLKSDAMTAHSETSTKNEVISKSDRIIKTEMTNMEESTAEMKSSPSETRVPPNVLMGTKHERNEIEEERNPHELKQSVSLSSIAKRILPRHKDRQNFIEPKFTISIDKNANIAAPSLNVVGPITRV